MLGDIRQARNIYIVCGYTDKCSRQFVAGAATQNNGRRGNCIKQCSLIFVIPLWPACSFIPDNAPFLFIRPISGFAGDTFDK